MDRLPMAGNEIELPKLRNDEETLKERLTENAYERILPARYLSSGETQEDLFTRVAQNLAVAEAVYTREEVTVTPSEVKPDHPNREELLEDVFGEPDPDQSRTVPLTEENASYIAYEPLIDRLEGIGADKSKSIVNEYAGKFERYMEELKWIPNSPTLMNAGDELQQCAACFVSSPEDDMDDIHVSIVL